MVRRQAFIIGTVIVGVFVLCLTYSLNTHYRALDHEFNSAPSGDSLPMNRQHFPKKIWQLWKDDSENPTERTVGFPKKWRMINPQHRYERFTHDNCNAYVEDRFPASISQVFTSLTDPILRADLLRYLIMMVEGGIWADIDVFPHQPVSSWISKPYYENSANLVLGIENDKHKRPIWPGSPYSIQLAQYTILAKPNHPAIISLVDRVISNLARLFEGKRYPDRVTFAEVMSTTGPFAFTEAMMDYFTNVTGTKHTGDELDSITEPRLIGDVLVLPIDSFAWLPQRHQHEAGHQSILVEHLFMGSWRAGHPG
ncbi:nucleotide-diphospho-sugar transferase [Xylaria arbuscula]|nr:nucleotide-diphospho-sugar transferase [Xylaria arbuscula]